MARYRWPVNLDDLPFKWGEEVWSCKPIFFHGYVAGFYITEESELRWVCQSKLGNLMIVRMEDLQPAKKPVVLVASTK